MLARSCQERLLQMHSASESNEIRGEEWQCKAMGVPAICCAWEGEGNVPSLPLGTFPAVGQSQCLEPLRKVLLSLLVSLPVSVLEFDQS